MVKSSLKFTGTSYACRLRAVAGVERLILMTDMARLSEPERAIEALPPDSIVIFRDYDHPDRAKLATQLLKVARGAGCWFLIAGDPLMAQQTGADGVHLPEYMLQPSLRHVVGFQLVTAACHSVAALWLAYQAGANLAIVSPVFPTGSHPDQKTLGVHRFSRLLVRSKLPVAALGGICLKNARHFKPFRLAGIAGISGISG